MFNAKQNAIFEIISIRLIKLFLLHFEPATFGFSVFYTSTTYLA